MSNRCKSGMKSILGASFQLQQEHSGPLGTSRHRKRTSEVPIASELQGATWGPVAKPPEVSGLHSLGWWEPGHHSSLPSPLHWFLDSVLMTA